jgi:hypothetical protein
MSEANKQRQSGSVSNTLLCSHEFGDVFNCLKCGIAIENLPLMGVTHRLTCRKLMRQSGV